MNETLAWCIREGFHSKKCVRWRGAYRWEDSGAGKWEERNNEKGTTCCAPTRDKHRRGGNGCQRRGLDLVGDDVGGAVGAAEERVGFFVVEDLLGGGIEI